MDPLAPTVSFQLLREIKQRHGLRFDNECAALLGISKARYSSYRTGRTEFDADLVPRVAELTGRTAEEIFALVAAERAKTPAAKEAFTKLARLARTTHSAAATVLMATFAILSLLVGIAPRDALASQVPALSDVSAPQWRDRQTALDVTVYTMRTVLQRIGVMLRRFLLSFLPVPA